MHVVENIQRRPYLHIFDLWMNNATDLLLIRYSKIFIYYLIRKEIVHDRRDETSCLAAG